MTGTERRPAAGALYICCLAMFILFLFATGRAGGATIQGVLQDSSGRPVANALIVFYKYPNTIDQWDAALSDATGKYASGWIPAHSYRILTVSRDSGYTATWYPNRPSPDQAEWVTVASDNETKTLNMTFGARGSVRFFLIDTNGRPIPGIQMNLYDESFNFRAGAVSNSLGISIATGIPGGSYLAMFSDNSKRYPSLWYDGARDFTQAVRIVVPETGGAVTRQMRFSAIGRPGLPFLFLLLDNP